MWLFEETRSLASQLDAVVTASTDTVSSYRTLLVRTLGFEAPLESALAYTSGLHGVCELRSRAGLIVHDLLALGMGPKQIASLPQCALAPFGDVATALGWLYVYERARLQHPLLCARLTARLPEVKDATDYFCRDEVSVTRRWDDFAGALQRFADADLSHDAIRDGARDAFAAAASWYGDDALLTQRHAR